MSTVVLSPLAVCGIRLYQRFISPYKGFCCANRAATKGWSCSEFGRRAFARYDMSTAYALLQRRFAACKRSYEAMKAKRFAPALALGATIGTPHAEDDAKAKKNSRTCDGGSCDLPAMDCGTPDIGACDCSF